jgi:hypothetical protein
LADAKDQVLLLDVFLDGRAWRRSPLADPHISNVVDIHGQIRVSHKSGLQGRPFKSTNLLVERGQFRIML